jgi:peroxiredoxin
MELLRDRSADFEAAGVRPFGISRDSAWTHIAWSQALDLNFPLLSDWNGEAIRAFGVESDFRGHQGVAERSAFLVDPDGTVRGAWRYETAEVPDFDELLRAAQAS